MTQSNILSINNLSYVIADKHILRNISFAASVGEFIGIIGPNGAGKSTLLRCIRGITPPSAGQVLIHNTSIQNFSERELAKRVAYMQQDVSVNFDFSALDIVLTGRYPHLEWWQNERQQDIDIARKNMAFTGVEKLEYSSVNQVSGGERQRILFAKALTQETDILFLDEPTANLDLVYQEEIFRYCQTICGRGKTVLMVVHDLRLAAKFCSRLILLAKGNVLVDGLPDDVLTSKYLEQAYHMDTVVFKNKTTGLLDIYTYEAGQASNSDINVHIIGGGGTVGDIIRQLFNNGYKLSGGVFHQGDSDADVAEAFQMDVLLADPFCAVSNEIGRLNREKIAAADVVILANLYFGPQNIDNLQAAAHAKKLIIVEDSPIEQRDYVGGQAVLIYKRLIQNKGVIVLTSEELLQMIEDNKLADQGVQLSKLTAD